MEISGTREMELLERIGFVRTAGSKEEEKAAHLLADEIESIGCKAKIEPFKIQDADIVKASLTVLQPYKKEYQVTGYKCAKSTPEEGITADLIYAENMLDVNLAEAKGKVVLVNGRVGMDAYKKLIKAQVAGFISMQGTLLDRVEETDLDTRKIRKNLETQGLTSAVNIRIGDAFEMVEKGASKVNLVLDNKNVTLTSHNVYAEIKGTTYPEEIVSFGAHYDSVPFSTGVYDNGAGSVIIMEALRYFKANPPKRTVKFMWYGSEEIGLEGSKHYVKKYAKDLEKHQLMINVDVAGSVLGSESCMVTGPECLSHFTDYFMKTEGYAVRVKQDIYSSDCIPFADAKVPAMSFCRFAPEGGAFIHNRNDVIKYLAPDKLQKTTEYVVKFGEKMINATAFPVPHEIPDNIVEKVDKYLFKKEMGKTKDESDKKPAKTTK